MTEPNSAQARDLSYVLHPQTNLAAHRKTGPLVVTRGEGVYVYDDAGKRYIEGLAGLWCASLGFSEPRLAAAADRQLRTLPFGHMFGSRSHEPGIDLAEELIRIAPPGLGKVFFANSGSEANDTAIKLVWYVNNALGRPQRKKIISRQRAYHGVTVAAASLTGLPPMQQDFDLPIANILHTDCPDFYHGGLPGETEEQFSARLADNLEKLIQAEGPDTVAAFIAEPVMGAGGVVVPPKGYFAAIQAVLRKYGILFIVDEVICGFGRTGNMFACETFDLKPDMLTVAKALSAAFLPISALLISDEINEILVKQSEKLGVFGHGYTYSAHPVSAAVALETLKIYRERDIVGHVRRMAPAFAAGLERLGKLPLVGQVRGLGLIGAAELVRNRDTRENFDPKLGIGARVVKRALDEGVMIRSIRNDSLALCPPLIIDEAQIKAMFDGLEAAITAVTAELKAEGLI